MKDTCVWALLAITEQGEYTEPHCYSSAEDSCKIVGIFSTPELADAEREKREALEDDDSSTYYTVEQYTVDAPV